MILTILGILFTFGIIILFHEFGHFVMFKIVGIKVLKFAIGFGPIIFEKEFGGTLYSVRCIPLGGFVKPAGEEIDEIKNEPGEFYSQPWYRRLYAVIAGSLMNYVLGLIVFSLVFFAWGKPTLSDEPVVGNVFKDKPAYEAGVRPNDRILSINSVYIESWHQLAEFIHGKADQEINVQLKRGEKIIELKVIPELNEKINVGIIGISPSKTYKRVGLFGSINMGVDLVLNITVVSSMYLWEKITKLEKPKEISGPLGIGKIVSEATKEGLADFLLLVGVISVAVGWFNLLPLLPLDGGHIVLLLYEGISRRRVNKKVMQVAAAMGFALLILVLIFATYNDVVR
ncbi:MAG: M50 family metallopeptidase [bacterium]